MKKKTIAVILICTLFLVMTAGASSPTDTAEEDIFGTAVGEIEEDTYVNEYFGLGFDLPKEWVFFTEEELAEMMDITLKVIDDEELKDLMRESMESGNGVTNMAAKNSTGTLNINMRLTKYENEMLKTLSEESILDMLSSPVKEMLEQAGYKDVELEIREIEFAGEKKQALFINGTFYNLPMYQAELLLLGEDYYSVITFTSVLEDRLEEQFECWHVLDEAEEKAG